MHCILFQIQFSVAYFRLLVGIYFFNHPWEAPAIKNILENHGGLTLQFTKRESINWEVVILRQKWILIFQFVKSWIELFFFLSTTKKLWVFMKGWSLILQFIKSWIELLSIYQRSYRSEA